MTRPEMTGKVALVTGASSGIGLAKAIAFAEAGARVVCTGLNTDNGNETIAMVHQDGGEGFFVEAAVTEPDQVEEMVSRTIEDYGGLNYAFNNAGIASAGSPATDISEDDWRQVIDVNLTGVWLSMKHDIPQMLKQGDGAIVNCASVLGQVGFAGSAAYVASKHGILGLTKSAALDYSADGIRIMAVCPGFIRTPMIEESLGPEDEDIAPLITFEPIGRLGKPEEVAAMVVWLCSDEASYVTESSMVVDGGWIAGYRF